MTTFSKMRVTARQRALLRKADMSFKVVKSTLILRNSGTMLIEQMSHNWICVAGSRAPDMSGEKQTLHSTVRPSQVSATVSQFAEAEPHQDLYDFQSLYDPALYEGIAMSALEFKQHTVMKQDNHSKQEFSISTAEKQQRPESRYCTSISCFKVSARH